MAHMEFVYTRSGIGPRIVQPRAIPTRLPITYWVPTPRWMLADGITTARMMRCGWVGYRSHIARNRNR